MTSEAPERIWAWPPFDRTSGHWASVISTTSSAYEYVRADIYAAAIERAERAEAERDALASDAAAARKRVRELVADSEHQSVRLEEAIQAWDARLSLMEAERDALRAQVAAVTDAAGDVLAERRRQIEAEGWTPEHDDQWANGEMAKAAGCYAFAANYYHVDPYVAVLSVWPWARNWLKPTNPRRDLVKAGALILAEIERRDRNAALRTMGVDPDSVVRAAVEGEG